MSASVYRLYRCLKNLKRVSVAVLSVMMWVGMVVVTVSDGAVMATCPSSLGSEDDSGFVGRQALSLSKCFSLTVAISLPAAVPICSRSRSRRVRRDLMSDRSSLSVAMRMRC